MDVREAAIILGVRQDATIEQVREAYRSHARLLHPDRLGEASEKDRATAHEAMARINDAYAVFQARLRVAGDDPHSRPSTPQNKDRSSDYPRPQPPPASERQQPREDRRLAQFDALLSDPRGWDLAGVLRIIRTYGATYGSSGGVSAVFESDDLDARGNPVFDEEVFVAKGVRAPMEGTLALRGGGNLALMGGKWEAERVLTLLGMDPSLAHPKRRSNRRALLFAGAGAVALIASLGVVAVLASDGWEEPVSTAGAASSASASSASDETPSTSASVDVPPPTEDESADAATTNSNPPEGAGGTEVAAAWPSDPRLAQRTARRLMNRMNVGDWTAVPDLCNPQTLCSRDFVETLEPMFASGQIVKGRIGRLYTCAETLPVTREEDALNVIRAWESGCSSPSRWLAPMTWLCSQESAIMSQMDVVYFTFDYSGRNLISDFGVVRSEELGSAQELPTQRDELCR